MQEPSTLKDIATALGVSLTTVHKVIYNKPGVSEQTRARILDYIRETGFQVNQAASALKRRAIRIIYAGVYAEKDNFYFRQLDKGVLEAAEDLKPFNVQISIRSSLDHPESQIELLQDIYDHDSDGLDGLLLFCSHEYKLNEMIRKFSEKGIRVITINSDAVSSSRDAYVGSDNSMIGALAAEYILNLGIVSGDQVMIMGGSRDFNNHHVICSSFAEYLRQAGADVDIIELFHDNNYLKESRTVSYLKAFPEIRAIYCTTSRSTYHMCKVLKDMQLSGHIKLIGSDVFPEIMPYFQDRTLMATIFQDPRSQANCGIKSLVKLITKEEEIREIYQQRVCLIMAANAASFL